MKKTFLFAGIFVIASVAYILFSQRVPGGENDIRNYPEAAFLAGKNWPYQQLADYFGELADKKGATYAFQILRLAVLPPNTDLHLLGHVVGDKLYAQKGLDGIYECTQEFRNACSHAIVVGIFADKGEVALPDIANACRKAPGGPGAYTMCFHGLGHGILSAFGYDMVKTIESCKKTGTIQYNDREYVECIGGAVMEIISGGAHDRDLWSIQRKKYLQPSRPLSLCLGHMPKEVQAWCFNYLTPYLFEAAGADAGNPGPEFFEKAFKLCAVLPPGENRALCYGGFGKEFVVLAQDRDIRRVDRMQEPQLQKVYGWCLLAQNDEGIIQCIDSALASLFWGGENDPGAAIKFCNLIADPGHQEACIDGLIGAAGSYLQDNQKKSAICGGLSEKYKQRCRQVLLHR